MISVLVLLYPALLLFPIVLYFASVQPKPRKSEWPKYLIGAAMVLSSFLPFLSMSHMNYLILWVVATGVLLVASAVVWMYGAFKNKEVFSTGSIMTAVTIIVSGVLIGNWVSTILAVIFLAVLVRYKREGTVD